MSKLDDLINKLCQDGVEFKKIENVCEISRGIVMSKDYIRDNAGEYPVFSSQTENNGCLGKINTYKYDGEYLTWTTDGANAGTVFYRKGKFSVTNVCGLLKIINEDLSTKFLYYALSIEAPNHVNRGMGNAKLMSNVMGSIKIPVPPIEIQNEIVQILDKFTSLEAELEAELEARRKQYEYYRDSLLLENKNAEWKTLAEIGTFERGRRFVHGDDREEGTPCIHYGELYTYYGVWANEVKTHIDPNLKTKLRFADKNDVIIVGAGENNIDIGIAVAWLGDYKVAIHDACYIFRHNQNPKYISYLLRTYNYHLQIKKYVSEGKICSISAEGIGKAKLPFPSLEEQERIVSILDRFESLCNDITSGLPAEIEARHKQYEYYRDKLLTFKRKEV